MTKEEFYKKFTKPLMTRAEVIESGISEKMIDDLRVELVEDKAGHVPKVPFGKIGAISINGGRKHLYRRGDVARIYGFEG
jgi:hypothetical protein